MTAQQSWARLKSVTELHGAAHVLVGSQQMPDEPDDGDEPLDPITVVNRLQMAAGLSEQFRDLALGFLAKKARKDTQLAAYDTEYKIESHEVAHLRVTEHAAVRDLLAKLPDSGNAPTLDPNGEALKRLRFYALKVKTPDNRVITLISPLSRNKELTQRNAVIATFSGQRFEALEDTSLVFEPTFAAVAFESYLFIFKQGAFERLFDQGAELEEIARETLEEIKAHVPIANFDAFSTDSLGHLNKLRKLRNIKLRGYIQDITIASVQASIDEFGADTIRVAIVTEAGVQKLQYDPEAPWALLELLEDRFVKSTMTGRHYAANSKRDLDAP